VLDRLNRHDLTDEEWERLRVFLPADPPRGSRWLNHRMVINGIFFRTWTGCPWRDLPEGFGNWKTVYNRHRRWSCDGTWQEILGRLRVGCDGAEGKDWTLSADSTVVRAHQHAAGARRALPADLVTRAAANDKNPAARPGREALGRSRGGLGTKIHLTADRRCRPVSRILSPGQHGDCPQFIPLMQAVASAAGAWNGPAPGPAPRWPTGPTPPLPTAPTCASAGSRRSSR
jgi:transposase